MSIKRLDPNATFDIVTVHDDAIEFESGDEFEALKTDKKDKDGNAVLSPTRYEKYLETFDVSQLKFKEGQLPTLFRVRCLKADEKAQIDEKYQSFDVLSKRVSYVNRHEMMLDIFKKGVLGIVTDNGKVEKVNYEELEYKVATDIGAAISLLGSLGKNLKKA